MTSAVLNVDATESRAAASANSDRVAAPTRPAVGVSAGEAKAAPQSRKATGEDKRYGDREQASAGAQDYRGGDALIIGATTTTIILAIILLVVLL